MNVASPGTTTSLTRLMTAPTGRLSRTNPIRNFMDRFAATPMQVSFATFRAGSGSRHVGAR